MRRVASLVLLVVAFVGCGAQALAQTEPPADSSFALPAVPSPGDSATAPAVAAPESVLAPSGVEPLAPSSLEPSCNAAPGVFRASWIPARAASAETGSKFVRRTTGWDGRKRQAAALEELRQGNVPDFLRQLKPVQLRGEDGSGRTVEVTVWVSPDYVSIGSDSDFVRMPLSLPVAVTMAQELGFVLPTQKIVDAVYEQSDFHFTPQPLPPGVMMRSSQYYARHNALIEEQRRGRPLGELVSGHKKDIVLTNRVFGTERIAIYGWHKRDGKPIQGLSLVHGARYADYSHGVRLVYSKVCVEGELRSIFEVLEDPKIAGILSYEGWVQRARTFMRRRAWK